MEERFFTGQEEFKFRHVGHLGWAGSVATNFQGKLIKDGRFVAKSCDVIAR